MGRWQLQEAKQQFSRLVDRARSEGPQLVTRHGREVAVVLGVDDYRRLQRDDGTALKRLLLGGPKIELEIERDSRPARTIDL
jgi:prevent-host-death family protein